MTSRRTSIRPAWRVNVAEALLDDHVARHGASPALRFPGGAWTLNDLAERVGRLAAVLDESGVGAGDRVALALPDSPGWVVAFLAIVRRGAIAVLVPTTLQSDRRVDAIFRAAPALLITNTPGLAPGIPVLGPEQLTPGAGTDPGPAATRGSDPAYFLLTSGSTGPSKWAIHRHRDIPFCLATYGRHVLRLRPGDVTYSVASLASSYGLGNSVYFPLGAGASAWIDGTAPSPQGAAEGCSEGGVTAIFGVPTFWARLARHVATGRVSREAFAAVRLAVSAGEPLPVPVFDAVRRNLGLELVDGLGSSEATNLYLSNRPGRAIRGTVGYPVPGFALRVCDTRDRPVPAGEPGQLLVRGGSIMAGYFDNETATSEALAGGWLHTGDVVRRDDGGVYRFLGRLGDRFKSGGLWVDPHRVVGALGEHRDVAEVSVVGVPDDVGVVRVVAVVGAAGVDRTALEDELRDIADALLAPHERPRAYVIADELPTTASGKIRRDAVAVLAANALTGGSTVDVAP